MCLSKFCAKTNYYLKKLAFRHIFLLGGLAALGLLLASHFIENFLHVIPCQLCMLQRFTCYLLAAIFLVGALHNPSNLGRYAYCGICFLATSFGLLVAGRQIWIQSLPLNQIPECAPGLERLLAIHPLLEVIKIVFRGTSECFKIHFTILGLPLSNWSFISFLGFASVCIYVIYRQKKRWL